jgi:FkbM family methyltransferase
MPHSSIVTKMTRLVSTPGMPVAYSRWLWSSIRRGEGPAVPCANTNIRGWISFSDYWHFHSGISQAQRRLIENCLRKTESPRPTAFDIGAHLGIFTAELAGRGFAEVHSFEPTERTFARLKGNIESSPSTRGTVKLNRVAVGPRNGTVEFQLEPDAPATNRVCLAGAGKDRTREVQQIPMTTLDSYCEKHGIEQIDFLKIDTEGLEPYVIDGAQNCLRNGRVPVIVLELCPPLLEKAGTSVAALYDRLVSTGYWPHELDWNGKPGPALTLEQLEKIAWADIIAIPHH